MEGQPLVIYTGGLPERNAYCVNIATKEDGASTRYLNFFLEVRGTAGMRKKRPHCGEGRSGVLRKKR